MKGVKENCIVNGDNLTNLKVKNWKMKDSVSCCKMTPS